MNWDPIPGFGVAGNFAGHLEQAGESPDFKNVSVESANAPKGIFPFYIPNTSAYSFLGQQPYSNTQLRLSNDTANHQIEPEVSILFTVQYSGSKIQSMKPTIAMAHNDCSIRKAGARKISEKKNWGPHSKGISSTAIPIDSFDDKGILHQYSLGCYLLRDGVFHKYGQISKVNSYSYFDQQLVDWLVVTLNSQKDKGPLEDCSAWLEAAGYPERILISIGATRYTQFGESTFLTKDDVVFVVLYPHNQYSEKEIELVLQNDEFDSLTEISVLKQHVVSI